MLRSIVAWAIMAWHLSLWSSTIVVSLPVYAPFVRLLAGPTHSVSTLVSPDTSFHTYEPTPRDIKTIVGAQLWFYVGDPFEQRIHQTVQAHHSSLVAIDLRHGVEQHQGVCCHQSDPHMWLDPHIMRHQVSMMARSLCSCFPNERTEIEQRSIAIDHELERLCLDIDELLTPARGQVIVVAHGAYGYLCHRYGLVQLSLDKEGKDATPSSLAHIIDQARTAHVRTIFAVHPYHRLGVDRMALWLQAQIEELHPYSEEYVKEMYHTARCIHKVWHDRCC